MTVEDCIRICQENDNIMLEPRDQFDPLVRGVMLRAGKLCTVYSWDAVVEQFVRNGMSEEEAIDWVAYNVETPQCHGWPVLVSDD